MGAEHNTARKHLAQGMEQQVQRPWGASMHGMFEERQGSKGSWSKEGGMRGREWSLK